MHCPSHEEPCTRDCRTPRLQRGIIPAQRGYQLSQCAATRLHAGIRKPRARNNQPLMCCRKAHLRPPLALIARFTGAIIEQHPESCASGGVRDGAAIATLLLGIGIARDANLGLYTLRSLAPMPLPTQHKFGTGKRATYTYSYT
jgi:hypothetical protein